MPDSRPWLTLKTGRVPELKVCLTIAAGYLLVAQLALQAGIGHAGVPSLWLPAGLTLAVLQLFGTRWWPAVLLGGLIASLLLGEPIWVAAVLAAGITLGGVFGVWALRRLGFRPSLHRVRDALYLIGVAAAAPIVTAGVGTLTAYVMKGAPVEALPSICFTWWCSSATGTLLIAPLLLAWFHGTRPELTRPRILEIALLSISLMLGSVLLRDVRPGYEYTIFPLVCWAAVRFGLRGASTAVAIVTAVAVWYTTGGVGPLAGAGLCRLHLYLALLTGGSLLLSAMAIGQARVASALRASELRFRRMFEHADIGIEVVSPEGRILDANPLLQQMLGYSRDELLKLSTADVSHPDDISASDTLLKEAALGNRTTYRLTKRYLRKDGSVFWAKLTTTFTPESEEGPACVIGLVDDITEQSTAEEALRETSHTLQTLVDASPLAIYTLDKEGRVRTWNHAAEQMFGWSAGEVMGRPLPFLPPEAMDAFMKSLRRVLQGEPLSGHQVQRRRKDGRNIDLRVCAAPMRGPDGTVDKVIALAEDVSERRNLGEQLRQAQKMEAIGQLTGGIAHDFNNILTIIITSAALLEREISPGCTDLRVELNELQRAAVRGVELVRKLMAFSRRRAVEMKPLDLGQVIQDASRDLGRLLPASVQVAVQVESGAPLTINGDVGAIEQILFNLATNSRDAMPEGGMLRLRVYRAWLDEDHRRTRGWGHPGEYVVLAVSDTGCGMSPKVRARAFEPFFTTKEVGKGTGLGMAMVYGLVSQHKGYADLHSEEGRGTTVRIYFPAVAAAVSPPSGQPEEGTAVGGKERILVVDDEEGVRRSAVRVLSRFGYAVEEAADGEGALEAVGNARTPFDLVLTDMVMPRMGGMALYQELRRRDSGARVLLMSGHTAEDLDKLSQQDGTRLLHKPWSVTDLLRRVREALDERDRRPAVGDQGRD